MYRRNAASIRAPSSWYCWNQHKSFTTIHVRRGRTPRRTHDKTKLNMLHQTTTFRTSGFRMTSRKITGKKGVFDVCWRDLGWFRCGFRTPAVTFTVCSVMTCVINRNSTHKDNQNMGTTRLQMSDNAFRWGKYALHWPLPRVSSEWQAGRVLWAHPLSVNHSLQAPHLKQTHGHKWISKVAASTSLPNI